MFGKKILFLAAGYVAGNIVSSLYTSKKGKDFKADIKKAQKDGKETEVFLSNIFETQGKMFQDIGKMIPKEQKKIFDLKLKEFSGVFDTIKNQGKQFIENIEESGNSTVSGAAKKVSNAAKKVADTADNISQKTKK